MSEQEFDLIVIGAGINGTGVARDATLRGMRVAVLERNDVGFGASGNSSGMIHGGPRYLTHHPEVTYASCLDSGHIQRIAPHLLFRVPFLVPVTEPGLRGKAELATYDAFFQVYDRYQELKRSKTHLRFSADQVASLEPGLVRTFGAVSFDEWGIDGVRLCLENLSDACQRGARFFPRSTVTGLLRDTAGTVLGVSYQSKRPASQGAVRARLVVNATGAWSPLTLRALGSEPEEAKIRPGKGIHVFLDRRLSNFSIVTRAIDGRQIFLLPWQNMSVLGTTDDDFYGHPDDVIARSDEVQYLLEGVARVLPGVRSARAIGTWGGVRPTLYEWGKSEDALSREHRVVDHAEQGAKGLFSMVGGKLASYRMFAEEMVDRLGSERKTQSACQTHQLSLPGGAEQLNSSEFAREYGVSELAARRLVFRHGGRAKEVLEPTRKDQRSLSVVCPCEPVLEAEIRYAVKCEWASDVSDVARRTRLGLGACSGMRCAFRAATIVGEELGMSGSEVRLSAHRFLDEQLRRRLPALGPEQARMEALAQHHLRAECDYVPFSTEGDDPW